MEQNLWVLAQKPENMAVIVTTFKIKLKSCSPEASRGLPRRNSLLFILLSYPFRV